MSQGNNPTGPANNPFGGQQEYQDYLNRFRQGPQAVSEGEAAARYRQVAPQLPPTCTSSRRRPSSRSSRPSSACSSVSS